MATNGKTADANDGKYDKSKYDNLEWIHVNEIVSAGIVTEGVKEKLIRKTKENPFVPIGVLATTAALSFGLWTLKSGNRRNSQLMMRFRIGAQAFTIGAIIVGIAIGTSKANVKSTS